MNFEPGRGCTRRDASSANLPAPEILAYRPKLNLIELAVSRHSCTLIDEIYEGPRVV